MRRENDNKQADLSSFVMTNEEARLVGNLARQAYNFLDGSESDHHSTETWTKVEEIITGLENR